MVSPRVTTEEPLRLYIFSQKVVANKLLTLNQQDFSCARIKDHSTDYELTSVTAEVQV